MDKLLDLKECLELKLARQKTLDNGIRSLSIVELIIILLGSDINNKFNISQLAEEIVVKYQLSGLGSVSPLELANMKNMNLNKAVTLAAAIELGKRISLKDHSHLPIVNSPKDASDLLMPFLRFEHKEHFLAIMLSAKNHVIAQVAISIGSLNFSVVEPRELFKEAIVHNATSVILAHNHPSGDPSPSKEDIDITSVMVKAGEIMRIPVVDHIIIGDGKYVSLRDKGIIK